MARKLVWILLFFVAAIAAGVAFSLKPWQQYATQKSKADQATAEMRAAEHEKSDLVKQKARYESPIGKEQLARERGYKKINESPVEVQ